MSASNIGSPTNSTLGGLGPRNGVTQSQLALSALLRDADQRTSTPIQRFSTPVPGHSNSSFGYLSDVSEISIEGDLVGSVSLRLASVSERNSLQEVPQAGCSTSISNVTQKKLCEKKSRLEQIVTSQLASMSIRNTTCNTSAAEEPPAKKRKQIYKGADWNVFKPLYKNSLYEQVLNNPFKTGVIAEKWVKMYKVDSTQAMLKFLQFLVDVCGYQQFDVSTKFKFDIESHIQVVDFMQQNPGDEQTKTGKYLMSTSSEWSKQSQNAIYEFIKNFIEICNDYKILSDHILVRHMSGFVGRLSASTNRALCHTGIVVVVKMNTVLMEIQVKANETQSNYSVKLKETIGEVLKVFQLALERYGFHNDPALEKMKITFIEEMWKWFKIDPSVLSTTKYFRRLMSSIIDGSSKVRAATLATCYKMIETNDLQKHLTPLRATFVDAVAGRFYDVDYNVAIASAEILRCMLNTYPHSVPKETCNSIMMRIYCKYVPLAMVSGKFLITLLSKCGDLVMSKTSTIEQLIRIAQMPEVNHLTPCLVESLLPHCPELQDWSLMIYLLLKSDMATENHITLIDIMCNSVQETITGKSKVPRSNPLEGKRNDKKIKSASHEFLQNLPLLLKRYSTDAQCMQKLTELLLFIEFEDPRARNYKNELTNIIRVLRPAFNSTTDVKLLETISQVFARLCKNTCSYNLAPLALTLKEAVVDAIQTKFDHILEVTDPSQETLEITERRLLQLSILFSSHDMTNLIAINLLYDWMDIESVLTAESIKYLITCCRWYLIWQLRQVIRAESGDYLKKLVQSLKSNWEQYINICFEHMNNSQSIIIRNEAFDCICKCTVQFQQELEQPAESNWELKLLIPKTFEGSLQNQLRCFAEKLIFHDNEIVIASRRAFLRNIINLTVINVIDVQQLTKIYKYYHSHYSCYGDIFNNYLTKLTEKMGAIAISGFILNVIKDCLPSVIPQNDEIDSSMQNENVAKLRKLSKQFQMFILSSTKEAALIIQLGTNFALADKTHYEFLYFIRCFIPLLSANEKTVILNYITQLTTEENEGNKYITDFVQQLKDQTSGRQILTGRRSTLNTTITRSNEEEIEDEDTLASTSQLSVNYTIEEPDSDQF